MFFRPASDPAPGLLPAPWCAAAHAESRACYSLPLSGFRIDLVTWADRVLQLEVRDSNGDVLAELPESPEALDVLGVLEGGWRGGTAVTGRWALAVGRVVPHLTYLTFLTGRRARASGRLSMAPTRVGPFWYVECDLDATRVDAVVAGRSTGVQKLRSWTSAQP
jgi:hypothetical protein